MRTETFEFEGYSIWISGGIEIYDPDDDFIDVHVTFDNGEKYVATFFTIRNILSSIEECRRTGEYAGGVYFWASDMVIIERISIENVVLAINDLIKQFCFEIAFKRKVDSSDTDEE